MLKKVKVLCIIAFLVIVVFCCTGGVCKADTLLPMPKNNRQVNLIKNSSLVAVDNGYMRVFYDGTKINVEYYDGAFNITSRKSISMELEYWGGFYAGTDGYYVVEGQSNEGESDAAEVIRVIKYNASWTRVGAAPITSNSELFGGKVRYPFDYGCLEMTEYGGNLYIVTGHQGYVDPIFGQGHQGFLMIRVNTSTMTGNIVSCDLWHSFAQHICNNGEDLYVLEQSEGSRYTQLSKINANTIASTSIPVLQYGGSNTSPWALPCYASVDDVACGSQNVLGIGTSIDQTNYDNATYTTSNNIYLTITPQDNFSKDASKVVWLTNFNNDGKGFFGVNITKVNSNRFLVFWEECENVDNAHNASLDDTLSDSILHYIFVDENGNKLTSEYKVAASISDCHPILNGSQIVYYASNCNMVDFYTIDANTGSFSKKMYRVAGEKITWQISGGVLSLTGTGTIDVDFKKADNERMPITLCGYEYILNCNSWDCVKKSMTTLVINSGITAIGDNCFNDLDNLKQVEIKPGLTSIGKDVFCGCSDMEKVIIPDSVTCIGDNFLWTGLVWSQNNAHVYKGTIYAANSSYAIKYAKKNHISYVASGTSISNAVIKGLAPTYTYNGKQIKPAITIKVGSTTLRANLDYSIMYLGCTRPGKAKLLITGENEYVGSIQKTFIIVPGKQTINQATSPKKGQLSVKIKKDRYVSGYQIQISQKSKFNRGCSNYRLNKKTYVTKTISGLRKNKKYYVRIRAYKIIGSKNYYGPWSKSKVVKIRSKNKKSRAKKK